MSLVCKFAPWQAVHEGGAEHAEKLGGKGANLCEMAKLGVPVPHGVIIPTDACVEYMKKEGFMGKQSLVNTWTDEVIGELHIMSEDMGDEIHHHLYSVRSGARVSMPGMMDTVLNVGITADTLSYWEYELGEWAAWDCYRRLFQMYGNVVFDIPMIEFEGQLTIRKYAEGVTHDSELSTDALVELVEQYRGVYYDYNKVLPDTLGKQLKGAIEAVWKSWEGPRAVEYRNIHNIPHSWGTAVNVQAMVYGNMNDQSCSGVVFSRNPDTGACELYGEFLPNAQGEDVVAGIRTPILVEELVKWDAGVAHELYNHVADLEAHYQDMQDIEFTVQSGKLFILQTRNGKRSTKARVRIAYELFQEGAIEFPMLKERLTPKDLIRAATPTVDMDNSPEPIGQGIAAGGGVVTGKAVFSSHSAVNCNNCILVTKETTPDDIAGMNASIGILTQTGGMTSHAAVVARGMNKSCVVGATDLSIGENSVTVGGVAINAFDTLTIDGSSGYIWSGEVVLQDGVDGVLEELQDLLMQGLPSNIVAVGRTKEDAIANRVMLPPSLYGVASVSEWAAAVKDAVEAGLTVYVDLSTSGHTLVDERLLSLTGLHIDMESTAKALLEANGCLDKVHTIDKPGEVTLEKFLTGKCGSQLDADTILQVFGSHEAYCNVIELMVNSDVQFMTIPQTQTKYQIIKSMLGEE